MAEEPIIETTVMVKPRMMPGRASGKSTWTMICHRLAPMACAASTRPWSTSRRLTSAMRAKKGVAAMLNGTTAAQIPIDVRRSGA